MEMRTESWLEEMGTARGDRAKGPSQTLNRSRDAVPADHVDHPPHYNSHPSGVECIDVAEWMSFCLGNAVKYIWRADQKGGIEDLRKAIWYLEREIARWKSEGLE